MATRPRSSRYQPRRGPRRPDLPYGECGGCARSKPTSNIPRLQAASHRRLSFQRATRSSTSDPVPRAPRAPSSSPSRRQGHTRFTAGAVHNHPHPRLRRDYAGLQPGFPTRAPAAIADPPKARSRSRQKRNASISPLRIPKIQRRYPSQKHPDHRELGSPSLDHGEPHGRKAPTPAPGLRSLTPPPICFLPACEPRRAMPLL